MGRESSSQDRSEGDHDENKVTKTENLQENIAALSTSTDETPDGGYGWVCVACCALINAHTWGINSSYGVFLAYYLANDVFHGATYLQFAFVGGLSISMAMLISPIATTIIGFKGTRVTLLVGVFFETLSLTGASFAKKIWHLFLSQGVCFGWGMGFLFVASVNVPPQWFTTRRGIANACSAAGSGIGGLVYSLATNAMIKNLGLGWAFRILGILAFAVNFTCAIIIRDRNKSIGTKHAAFDAGLFKKPHFVLLQGWGFFSMLGYIVLLFSLPNYAKQSVGLTAAQGSAINAILNLGQGLGRPPIGLLSDRVGRINMAMTATFMCGLFVFVIWVFADNYGLLIFFALAGGAVAGTFWATVAPVTVECLPMSQLPSALNITWLTLVLPTTFSEPMALEIASRSKAKYLGTQLFAGFMYIAAAACLLGVRMWKVGDNEREKASKRGLVGKLFAWEKV